MSLMSIREEIEQHPTNAWATKRGHKPIYSAHPNARIVIIGQAPGRKAQESTIPWNDISGDNLRTWLGLTKEQFYSEKIVSLLPMDFYYPGKGKNWRPTTQKRLCAHVAQTNSR